LNSGGIAIRHFQVASQSFNTAPVAPFNHFAVDLALLWGDNPRHQKSLPLDPQAFFCERF